MRVAKEEVALLLPSGFSSISSNEAAMRGMAQARAQSTVGLGRRIASAIAYLVNLPRQRAVVAELRGLSDRELADIGLNRADVPHVWNRAFANTRRTMASSGR